MKKGIQFSLIIFIIGIVFVLTGLGFVFILKYFDLMFRGWVGIVFFVIMMLLGLMLSIGMIYTLSKVFSRPQKQKLKRIVQKAFSAVGIVIILIVSSASWVFLPMLAFFAYQPEHITEKHNQKMVAYVNSFKHVTVEYHQYKNFLVCGYKVIGVEWYGMGGYDPFEKDPVPEPIRYKFYDTQGNLITQSEEKQNDF